MRFRLSVLALVANGSAACQHFVQPPPLLDPGRPAQPMPIGTTAVQAMAIWAVTDSSASKVVDTWPESGSGGGLRLERQVSRKLDLGIEGMAGAGGDRGRTWLGAGRIYAHLNPWAKWLALRFGLGGGDLSRGVPYLTGDASMEVSAIAAQAFVAYASLGVAASALLRSDPYLESVGYPPALNQIVCYLGGSGGLMIIIEEHAQVFVSGTLLVDPTARFISVGFIGGLDSRWAVGLTRRMRASPGCFRS